MKAELTTLDTATVEAEWLGELLMDLSMVEKPILATLMNCDNKIVITKVNSSKDNMKSSRHVKRQLESVRKLRSSGVIAMDYIPTAENLTDQFTNSFSQSVIDYAYKGLSLRPI
jgi:fructose-1,6-bisphosphatase/inositol monophosphatase family enzyme